MFHILPPFFIYILNCLIILICIVGVAAFGDPQIHLIISKQNIFLELGRRRQRPLQSIFLFLTFAFQLPTSKQKATILLFVTFFDIYSSTSCTASAIILFTSAIITLNFTSKSKYSFISFSPISIAYIS